MKTNKLHTIKNTGFKVPNDYFDGIEDAILSDIKLKEMVPESGYKLPDTYLDALDDTIFNKISAKETPKVISIFNRKNIIYISSAAAAILLLFNLFTLKNKSAFDRLDTETVENYIMDENIGSYEIVSLLLEENLLNEGFTELKIDEQTVETYILNNLDMENLIIE